MKRGEMVWNGVLENSRNIQIFVTVSYNVINQWNRTIYTASNFCYDFLEFILKNSVNIFCGSRMDVSFEKVNIGVC